MDSDRSCGATNGLVEYLTHTPKSSHHYTQFPRNPKCSGPLGCACYPADVLEFSKFSKSRTSDVA